MAEKAVGTTQLPAGQAKKVPAAPRVSSSAPKATRQAAKKADKKARETKKKAALTGGKAAASKIGLKQLGLGNIWAVPSLAQNGESRVEFEAQWSPPPGFLTH